MKPATKRNDFEIPADLSPRGRAAAEAVLEVLGDQAYGGGCRAFYSPEEWRSRGERYGCNSILILCHDGGDLAAHCNYDYGDEKAIDALVQALSKLGLYVENCTSWYSAVYPLEAS